MKWNEKKNETRILSCKQRRFMDLRCNLWTPKYLLIKLNNKQKEIWDFIPFCLPVDGSDVYATHIEYSTEFFSLSLSLFLGFLLLLFTGNKSNWKKSQNRLHSHCFNGKSNVFDYIANARRSAAIRFQMKIFTVIIFMPAHAIEDEQCGQSVWYTQKSQQ